MKKLKNIFYIVLVLVVLSLIGSCLGRNEDETKNTQSNTSSSQSTYKPGHISTVPEKKLHAPDSSESIVGMPYEDAVKLFEEAGFKYIDVSSVTPGQYADPSLSDGDVLYVEINGIDDFEVNKEFGEHASVDIHYCLGKASDAKVWVTESGSRYHSNAFCSGMEVPIEMTKSEAETRGYTACEKCH